VDPPVLYCKISSLEVENDNVETKAGENHNCQPCITKLYKDKINPRISTNIKRGFQPYARNELKDLALQQILSFIDLFLSYRTDYTDSRTILLCSTAGFVCMVRSTKPAPSNALLLNHCTFISFQRNERKKWPMIWLEFVT